MTSIKTLHIILSILFLSVRYTALPAQEYSISKEYFTTEDGLSSSQVYNLYRDSKGFMWFLTSGGADRYDGFEFEHYEGNASIKQLGGYNKIHEDFEGNIWLGYRRHRFFFDVYAAKYSEIHVLDIVTNELKPFEEVYPDCFFSISDITFIHQDETRKLWFALANGQAWSYDGQFEKIYDNQGEFPILTICPTPSNTVTLGIENKIIEITYEGKLLNEDIVEGKIKDHKVDKDGTIWISCVSGSEIDQLDHYHFIKVKGQKIQPFFDLLPSPYKYLDGINNMWLEDGLGRVWISFPTGVIIVEKSGRLVYDLSNELGVQGELRWMRLASISDGLIWFVHSASNKQGAFSLSIKKNVFRKYLTGASPTFSLRSMTDLNDRLLKINTYRGDLVLNLESGQYEIVQRNYIFNVGFGITKDSSGVLYTGEHAPHIRSYNPSNKEEIVYKLSKEIGDLFMPFIDKQQTIWIGGVKGLGYLSEAKDSLIVFEQYNGFPSMKGKEIFHFCENKEGIWIATSDGVYLLDPQKGVLDFMNDFPSQRISYIYKDMDDTFWLGTMDQGLIKWDRKQRVIRNFTKRDGLTDHAIHAIFEDDFGALWMSSNYGLMRFDKSTETINSFFEKDGTANNEFNRASYFQHPNGTFYFGGVNGLTAFHPKDFDFQNTEEKKKPVVTRYEKLDINSGSLVDETKLFFKENEINLSAEDKSFIVRFANLDYSHLTKKNHAYKIEDLDDKWIPLKENYVRVNQLSHGAYTLKIKSISRGGVWSDVLSIPITVAKPYYLNSGFLAFAILGSVCLIGGFIRIRTYQLRKRAGDLTIEVFKRTKVIEEQKYELEKSNKIKEKFLRLIGHDLKTPLVSLRGMSQKLEFLLKEKRYDDIEKLSASIDKSSSNMTLLLDNLLSWALMQKGSIEPHPEKVGLKGLVEEVLALYANVAEVKKINFEINNLEDFQVFVDRNSTLTIFRNLFDNAIKYSPVESVIRFNVVNEKEKVSVQIENKNKTENVEMLQNLANEEGPASLSVKGLGLLICKELTELNNGVFSIDIKNNLKTIVCLKLPRFSIDYLK